MSNKFKDPMNMLFKENIKITIINLVRHAVSTKAFKIKNYICNHFLYTVLLT